MLSCPLGLWNLAAGQVRILSYIIRQASSLPYTFRQVGNLPYILWQASSLPYINRLQALIREFLTQDFADEGTGQLVPEVYLLGNLVGAKAALTEVNDPLGCSPVSLAQHDVGVYLAASRSSRDAHSRCFLHTGMLVEHLLHVAGVDVPRTDGN